MWTDFGGVLTPPIDDALDRVADAAGIPAAELYGAMLRIAPPGHDVLEQLELGQVSQAAWGRELTRELAPDWVPRIDLGRFGDHWYADRPFNTALFDGLLAAKRAGFGLGLLTNSVLEWEPHRRAMISDHGEFDLVIRSHEVGLRKPDPEIYRLAERSFGVKPARCLLIDDLAANCAAAQERGWRAILHRDTATTLAEVEEWRSGWSSGS
ncbi:HAD family phosphatase [Solihabitans fulvus]|uniref:HAD family phosphatase n=1 Tax=Solihabitans fulvus TaxID=1892852 RepID=A0A5B2XCP6_9PSEU|nr:HAD family phosphatase [Solihabitans fulvus]